MIVSAVRVVCRGAVCAALPLPANAYRPYLLRHAALAFLNALLLATTLGITVILTLTPEVARLSTITAPTLVRLANAERTENGVPPLRENSLLQRSAQLKAQHILDHDYFEHTSPDGLSPWVWFDRVKYDYTYAGENLAIDFTEAEDVTAAWMRSAGHRRNVLADRYTDIGIAVATGEFKGRTTTVVVQHFGSRSAGPSVPTVVAERQRSTNVAALAAPTVTEPGPGARVRRGPLIVRGSASPGTVVRILLDGRPVASVPTGAADGRFASTIPVPEDQEGVATIIVETLSGRATSPPSRPISVQLDTKAPEVAVSQSLLLPDPLAVPGFALLAVPVSGDVAQATLRLHGEDRRQLTKAGSLLLTRLNVADAVRAPAHPDPLVLTVSDDAGNTRRVALQTLLPYVTQEPANELQRPRVAAASRRARPLLAGILGILTAVLAVNVMLHLRLHRLLHVDLLGHAFVVLVIGTVLLLWT